MAKRGEVHNKIAAIFKSYKGEMVTLEQLKTIFKDSKIEPVLYRISTYVWNIKKNGGVVKAIKNKRKLIGYELINWNEFDDRGYWIGLEEKAA